MGSGKSTVCRLFSLYGAVVYDSDARTKQLMDADPELMRGIRNLLGAESYRDGRLDRAYVASRIFADRSLLGRFEALVHPAVGDDFDRWAAVQQGAYCILESAILFESGFDARVDRTVAVCAPEELRIARVAMRDGSDPQDIRARMANQMDDALRSRLADFTVINDGAQSLIMQVAAIDRALRDG